MSKTVFPAGYAQKEALSLFETQSAISLLKQTFEKRLCEELSLTRVSAPLFVECGTGINDDLNGVERAVRFDIRDAKKDAEVVHSLAKWKRLALWKYGFPAGRGLYTDMNAIRRDEELDNLHSVYVDQWDWEKILIPGTRDLDTLKDTVRRIANSVADTLEVLKKAYPAINTTVTRDVTFVTTQELLDRYPDLSAKERENAATKEYGCVFLVGVGDKLSDGVSHDGRAPEYDDWTLNGDLLYWFEPLQCALEVSSMGIRVNAPAMRRQLKLAGKEERENLEFHKLVLNGTLPDTIGGGIGQSRLCMLLLGKAHVGEVQSSVWDEDTLETCKKEGVTLL